MTASISRRIQVSPRRWMLLPIGRKVKVREFDGSAMLAFEAAERGWGTIIGGRGISRRTKLPRGILIEKSIAPGTSTRMVASQALGRKVSAWCEEGLVYSNAEEYGRRKVEAKTYDMLEMFFCWGQNHADDMNTLGCNGNKLFVTGNPRFDLHRADLRSVFDTRVNRLRQRYAPLILVNTKFSQFNCFSSSPAAALDKMRKLGKVQTAEQEAEAQGLIAFHKAGFMNFMDLVDVLSRGFPEHTIVVRPHPSERHEPWKAKANTLPNVEVICEGNVAEWILASEVCVHNNCTTGVEAYLLGKPAISYRPLCDPRFDLFLPNALSAEAFDIDAVVDLVSAALRGEDIPAGKNAKMRAEVARRFIENLEGKRACERIMDVLDSADLPEEPLSFSAGPLTNLKVAARTNIHSLRRVVRNYIKRQHLSERTWARESAAMRRHHALKSDNVNVTDLFNVLKAVQKVTGRYRNVRIAELESELHCIY